MTAWRCGATLSAAAFAFASFVLLLLAPLLMLWSEEKTPHRPCHPVGGFLASGALGGLWGKGPQWALPLLVHLAGGLMSRPAASGPVGAWPCIAEGCPRATAGGQLDQDAPQARPWPPHYPGQPPQGDGRGGRRHAAQGGQGCGPQAAGGGWDGPEGRTGAPTTARRRWSPSRCPQQLQASWPGVGSDAAADSGPAAERSSTGPSMVGPALWSGCCCTRSAGPMSGPTAPTGGRLCQ